MRASRDSASRDRHARMVHLPLQTPGSLLWVSGGYCRSSAFMSGTGSVPRHCRGRHQDRLFPRKNADSIGSDKELEIVFIPAWPFGSDGFHDAALVGNCIVFQSHSWEAWLPSLSSYVQISRVLLAWFDGGQIPPSLRILAMQHCRLKRGRSFTRNTCCMHRSFFVLRLSTCLPVPLSGW